LPAAGAGLAQAEMTKRTIDPASRAKPSVEIRPARRGELPRIRELVQIYPDKLMYDDLPGLRSFFVALTKGRIIGCCALQVYSRRLAEVRSLAVHPDFVGQGIGRRLVERCQQRARGRRVKQILTVSSAAGFFEQLGFSTILRERNALFYDVPRRQQPESTEAGPPPTI
jgi:N-acetylglutamate synthase-like GNAT family acetyltransferase